MVPYKKRLRTLFVWIGYVVIGIVLAYVLNFNVWLGISMIVLLCAGFMVYLTWGIPIRSWKIDWAQRQPKPKTQIEIRDHRKHS
jgi:membrane protein YdbS with pleckstrin-like domain